MLHAPLEICSSCELCDAGQEECERAVGLLEEEAGRLRRIGGKNALRIMPLSLFAGLPAAQQALALEAAPRNYRKVAPDTAHCCLRALD